MIRSPKPYQFPSTAGRPSTTVALGVAGLSLLAACGGGGGEDAAQPNAPVLPAPPPAATVQSGVFKDANVGGLSYVSGGESGVTGLDGRFRCETGAQVSFSIGTVELGSTECTSLVIPASLTASGELDDPVAVGLAQFLQMLDFDGDPTNGIEISAAVQEVAESWVQPDFAAADLEMELASIISDAFSVDQTSHDLAPATLALDRATEVAECAFAGAFYGTAESEGTTGSMMFNLGFQGVFAPQFCAGCIDWTGYEAAEEFTVAGLNDGQINYAALPSITPGGLSTTSTIGGAFLTPDRITGDWVSNTLAVSGTYDVRRLGSDLGTYRIIGRFDSTDGPGVLGLSLEGNTISGQAFDLRESALYDVNGTLDGDTVTLTADTGAELVEATGTLTRFNNGEPRSFFGSWPEGQVGGTFCRLN